MDEGRRILGCGDWREYPSTIDMIASITHSISSPALGWMGAVEGRMVEIDSRREASA